tara:strand:+ start:8151 stop:8390 length:240 start_codon:yes stop_codon:yes gene_type:complete
MTQTEAFEMYAMYACKLGLSIEILNLHFNQVHWRVIVTIPALLLGWTNALALTAIHETLGTTITNSAIFGNNTCTIFAV